MLYLLIPIYTFNLKLWNEKFCRFNESINPWTSTYNHNYNNYHHHYYIYHHSRNRFVCLFICLFACLYLSLVVGRLKVFQPFFYSVEWYIDREVPDWPWFLKDYNSSLDPCSSSQNSTTILVYFGVDHQLSHVEVRKKLAQQHRGPLEDW